MTLKMLTFLLVIGVPTASAAAGSDLTPEQAMVLEAVRTSALEYSQNLPNFICTQVTHRTATVDSSFGTSFNGASSSRGGSGGMGSLRGSGSFDDVIEERLTYFDQFEHYEVVAVNGRKVNGKRAHAICRCHQCRRIWKRPAQPLRSAIACDIFMGED